MDTYHDIKMLVLQHIVLEVLALYHLATNTDTLFLQSGKHLNKDEFEYVFVQIEIFVWICGDKKIE